MLCGCGHDMLKEQTGATGGPFERRYRLTEHYEIVGGPREGMKGESIYTVTLRVPANEGAVEIENFGNAYLVRATMQGDSLFIRPQKFAYYSDSVSISGTGQLGADSLRIEYMSGGPAGQIHCVATGPSVAR